MVALARRFSDQAALALERAEVEALHARLEEGLLARSHDSVSAFGGRGSLPSRATSTWAWAATLSTICPTARRGLSFVIGDVSGHGPEAAALGATLRSGWRVLALAGVS